jgi:hypothetical protein
MDVVSVAPSPGPRISGVPHCEQKRAPSGLASPHRVQ